MNAAGVELLKRVEGLHLVPHRRWTGKLVIGYGHTGDVEPHHVVTEHQADVILALDLERVERGVRELLGGVQLNENQFSALVVFAFDVGISALKWSRLMQYVRAGGAAKSVTAKEFNVWTYSRGKVLAELVERRGAERALFLAP